MMSSKDVDGESDSESECEDMPCGDGEDENESDVEDVSAVPKVRIQDDSADDSGEEEETGDDGEGEVALPVGDTWSSSGVRDIPGVPSTAGSPGILYNLDIFTDYMEFHTERGLM